LQRSCSPTHSPILNSTPCAHVTFRTANGPVRPPLHPLPTADTHTPCHADHTVESHTYRSRHNYSDLFGWAHPNRVLSQAVFQKVAARASEVWSRARSALLNLGIQRAHRVAFGRSARSKQTKRLTIFLAAHTGRTHWPHIPPRATRGAPRGRQSRPQPLLPQCGRKERNPPSRAGFRWAALHSAERANEFTAAGRRAGLANELHPKYKLAKSMAVPNLSSDPSEV
jgi:hypothetical protein